MGEGGGGVWIDGRGGRGEWCGGLVEDGWMDGWMPALGIVGKGLREGGSIEKACLN